MFNYLNSILYKSKIDTSNINEAADFQPFLVQRWCTMHSTAITSLINETTNRYWGVLDDKTSWYVALDTVIPKSKFKKITYIKKNKKELEGKDYEHIQKIANSLEISSREIINYIKDNNLKINLPKNHD
jgi:hypothetical protein